MGYPPPPPPPGQPGGYGPPTGPPPGGMPPGGAPPPGYGGPPTGGPGYGGPPTGGPGYGGPGYGGTPPPGGYAPQPPAGGKGSGGSRSLVVLMAALVVVVLLAVVGGLVLLNRDGGGDVELTEDQLREALVTEGDVGDGFTLEPEDDEEDADDEDFDRDDLDASEECIDLYEEFEAVEEGATPTVEAGATFEGDDGSQVEQTLEQGSEFTLDDVRQLVDTCPEIGIDDGESVGTLTFEVVDDVVDVGDESVTLRVEVDFDEPFDVTVPSLGVLWERAGTHASVNVTGAIDEETFEAADPDEGLLRDVVEIADEKLQEVIDEA